MSEAESRWASSRRLALPGGGWWDLSLQPLWKHVKLWKGGDECLVETAILHLTLGWSFDEPITVDALKARDPDDLACVVEAIISTIGAQPESRTANTRGNSFPDIILATMTFPFSNTV